MNTNYLVLAIHKLRPESEFSFTDNDYSTIQWNVLNGDAPTQEEIDAAIKQLKADEIAAEAKAATDKIAAQAKLAALGLTADDIKVLGL
jgi:hypothetical protein